MGGLVNNYIARKGQAEKQKGVIPLYPVSETPEQPNNSDGVPVMLERPTETTTAQKLSDGKVYQQTNVTPKVVAPVTNTTPPTPLTPPTSPTSPDTDTNGVPERVKVASMEDLAKEVQTMRDTMRSPEQRKEQERKDRIRKMRAGIFDGMSALASAIAVTNGGYATYDPKKHSLSARLNADLKEEQAKRDKEDAEWMNLMEKAYARAKDSADATNNYNWKVYTANAERKKHEDAMALQREKMENEKSQFEQTFAETKRANKAQEKIAWGKINAAEREARSNANATVRYKNAVTKAWAKLTEMAKENPDVAEAMRTAGNKRFNSRGTHNGEYYTPTIDQMKTVIAMWPEASEVFDIVFAGGDYVSQSNSGGGQGPVAPTTGDNDGFNPPANLPNWKNR